MPTTLTGRELIKRYINNNSISIGSLGAMYNVGKVYMSQVLSGKKTTKAANELVLKIIEDFKLGIKED